MSGRARARGSPTVRSFLPSFPGAPTEEGCIKSFSFYMPHVEGTHLFVALQFPIPFFGVFFVENLIECVGLFEFHFNFCFSLHSKN